MRSFGGHWVGVRMLLIAALLTLFVPACFTQERRAMCASRTINNCVSRRTIASCQVGDGCTWGPRCVQAACMNCDESRCDPGDGGPSGKRCCTVVSRTASRHESAERAWRGLALCLFFSRGRHRGASPHTDSRRFATRLLGCWTATPNAAFNATYRARWYSPSSLSRCLYARNDRKAATKPEAL